MLWKPNDDWSSAETIHQTLRNVNTIKNEKRQQHSRSASKNFIFTFFQLFILEGHHFEASSFVFCCSCLFPFNLERLKQTRELIKKLFYPKKNSRKISSWLEWKLEKESRLMRGKAAEIFAWTSQACWKIVWSRKLFQLEKVWAHFWNSFEVSCDTFWQNEWSWFIVGRLNVGYED